MVYNHTAEGNHFWARRSAFAASITRPITGSAYSDEEGFRITDYTGCGNTWT
jgi:pullulanase/glycogen debranching enzyme